MVLMRVHSAERKQRAVIASSACWCWLHAYAWRSAPHVCGLVHGYSSNALSFAHRSLCGARTRMHRPCSRPSLASSRGRVRCRRVAHWTMHARVTQWPYGHRLPLALTYGVIGQCMHA